MKEIIGVRVKKQIAADNIVKKYRKTSGFIKIRNLSAEDSKFDKN
jgi:hypothetical protein